jgi:hypothetical protein
VGIIQAATLAALLIATAAEAQPIAMPTEVVDTSIDWTRGVLVARGFGPADRHAPSPAVARVAAQRAAEDQARTRLAEAVQALPVAGGGTVQDAATGQAVRRLERAIARAPIDRSDLSSDGSARVEVVLGLEAVRQALTGPRELAPTTDEPTGATMVIDARAAPPAPAIGLAITAGTERWTGPVVFAHADDDVPARPGARVRTKARAARLRALTPGTLAIDGPLPAASALVVVLLAKKP